jgi:hypothetical protein
MICPVVLSRQGPGTTPSQTGMVTVAVEVVFVTLTVLKFVYGITGMLLIAPLSVSPAPLPRNSLFISLILWCEREVKKMAIDKGVTATEYLEQALREKLSKDKSPQK